MFVNVLISIGGGGVYDADMPLYIQVSSSVSNKGAVTNYGEGGGYKMGKLLVRNFLCAPPPPPPLKTG